MVVVRCEQWRRRRWTTVRVERQERLGETEQRGKRKQPKKGKQSKQRVERGKEEKEEKKRRRRRGIRNIPVSFQWSVAVPEKSAIEQSPETVAETPAGCYDQEKQ